MHLDSNHPSQFNFCATTTVVDSANVGALESALEQNNVSLFFTKSPTNPFLGCVDIKLVSELCHKNGVLLCIDGTFATPLNQKALALGADLVMHSCIKYMGGHHDILGSCISGSDKLISQIQILHNILGGALNSAAACKDFNRRRAVNVNSLLLARTEEIRHS